MTTLTKSGENLISSVIFSLLLVISLIPGISQNIAINTTGSAANAAAGLDVDFANKGLLVPRMALTGTTLAAPLAAHVAGMLVYNTATVADVTPGFYYNDGSRWLKSVPQPGATNGTMQYWSGTAWVNIPVGQPGQKLQLTSAGVPAWSNGVLAALTTTAMTLVTSTTATSGGNITSDGGITITARGVCWNTATGPTVANSKTVDGTGMGAFTSNLTGLTTATTYYVRAYATNSQGTAYGNEVVFTTP